MHCCVLCDVHGLIVPSDNVKSLRIMEEKMDNFHTKTIKMHWCNFVLGSNSVSRIKVCREMPHFETAGHIAGQCRQSNKTAKGNCAYKHG